MRIEIKLARQICLL